MNRNTSILQILSHSMLPLFALILTNFTGAETSSGLFAGLDAYYLSSRVESKFTDPTAPGSTEQKQLAVSGFGQGLNIGYRRCLNDKIHLGVSLEYLTAEIEQTEIRKTAVTTIDQQHDLTFNNALYPTIQIGFSPSSDTILISKFGYGTENWTSNLTKGASNVNAKDKDETGLIIGAEALSYISNKVLLGLSAMYSSIDSFNLTGGTCTHCLAPETLSISAKVQYQPNGGSESGTT